MPLGTKIFSQKQEVAFILANFSSFIPPELNSTQEEKDECIIEDSDDSIALVIRPDNRDYFVLGIVNDRTFKE